jgi:hypothetical protein
MIARTDKRWELGPTALTLLVAYLLVLQGIAVGVASGQRSTSGLYANSTCFSRSANSLDGDPSTPARPARHGDICCVFHCAGFGATGPVSSFVVETPPASFAEIKLAFDERGAIAETATPPLGSRAPPATI